MIDFYSLTLEMRKAAQRYDKWLREQEQAEARGVLSAYLRAEHHAKLAKQDFDRLATPANVLFMFEEIDYHEAQREGRAA